LSLVYLSRLLLEEGYLVLFDDSHSGVSDTLIFIFSSDLAIPSQPNFTLELPFYLPIQITPSN
jgi:hypothetical protein